MDLHYLMAWAGFLALVLVMLAFDLFVLHKKPHAVQLKEALIGALVPVIAALLFVGAIYYAYSTHFLQLGILPQSIAGTPAEKYYPNTGGEASLFFLTGYLVELSLSADNVFLFVILMSFFKVPRQLQHRVLFWGVLGALVMRGIMIILGSALLARFQWIIYLFGAFLVFTGIKMFFSRGAADPSDNLAVRIVRKLFPFQEGYDGQRFFTRIDGKRVATTLFLVLVCIEFTDLVFALDSIPAIFGITRDVFIVFTSNVFAVLGLRSMYFLLTGVIDKFHLLKYGLAVVLAFVGVKMILPGLGELYGHFTQTQQDWEINKYLSLTIIIATLALSVLASLLLPRKGRAGTLLGPDPGVDKAVRA